jgi:hypothetical protein
LATIFLKCFISLVAGPFLNLVHSNGAIFLVPLFSQFCPVLVPCLNPQNCCARISHPSPLQSGALVLHNEY